MNMEKTYRTGATGALLDEYERAITDLKNVIRNIPDAALLVVTDPNADEHCRSLQAILSHVVHAGYGYATSIHNHYNGQQLNRPDKVFHKDIQHYLEDLELMFQFTAKVFLPVHDTELEEMDQHLKIKTGWGQLYDIEQLMEHAIVHILRHRRQIERLKDNGLWNSNR